MTVSDQPAASAPTSDFDDDHVVLPQWERAECTCPDWCERDHELD